MRDALSAKTAMIHAAVIASLFIFAASTLQAQAPAPPEGRPELTQADIAFFIDLFVAVKANPDNPEAQNAVFDKHGMDTLRASRLLTRVNMAISMLSSGTTRKQAAEHMGSDSEVPSDAELALVKDNLSALNAARRGKRKS
jgi:hypothetical protein